MFLDLLVYFVNSVVLASFLSLINLYISFVYGLENWRSISFKCENIDLENKLLYVKSTLTNDNYIRTSAINKEHLHNHLIVNSISFENGYKIQMSKKDLQYLKDYSDKICLEIGASVVPKKDKTNYIKRNEYRVAERGESWKFKLINAIDLSIAESTCKEDFIKLMNKLGYQVNWTDTRKYITYTTPEGYKCRDNKLFEEKYLKEKMEEYYGIKRNESITNSSTNEYENGRTSKKKYI